MFGCPGHARWSVTLGASLQAKSAPTDCSMVIWLQRRAAQQADGRNSLADRSSGRALGRLPWWTVLAARAESHYCGERGSKSTAAELEGPAAAAEGTRRRSVRGARSARR